MASITMGELAQYAWAGLSVGAEYAFMAFGFALIYATTRILHFAHLAVAILLAYVIYWLAKDVHLPVIAAVAVAVPTAFALGAAFQPVIYGITRRRAGRDVLPGGSLFIASLGVLLFITNVIPLVAGSAPLYVGGAPLLGGVVIFHGQVAMTYVSVVAVPSVLLVSGGLLAWLRFAPPGQRIRAVMDDPNTAAIVGIRVARVNAWVLGVGSVVVVGVSVIELLLSGANSQTSDDLMIITVAAMVVGGIGSVGGAVIAAFLLGVISNVAVAFIPYEWTDALIYAVLIAVLMARPQGMFGHRAVVRRV